MTTTMAILLALANDTPPTPHAIRPEIPVALSQLVTALLEKQPDNRPHSAEAVLAELRRIAEQPIQKIVTSTTTHAGEVLVPSVLSLEDSDAPRGCNRTKPKPAMGATGRRFAGVALLLLAVGFGVWGAVLSIRVTTPKGTLLIESDDDNVEVRITQNGVTIIERTKDRKLELTLGEYGVELVNPVDGLTLSAETFTITRGGQPPIRVSHEQNKSVESKDSAAVAERMAIPMANDSAPLEATSPAILEHPQVIVAEGNGRWRVQDGELWCPEPTGNLDDWLFFGLQDWTDYDFTIEARSEVANEGHGPGVFFRASPSRRAALVTFNVFRSNRDYFDEIDRDEWRSPWNDSTMPVYVGTEVRDWTQRWREIRVSFRGRSARVFIEGTQILAYNDLSFPNGSVGVRSNKACPSRYRLPKVTLPDGRLLLDGWPAMPQSIYSIDTAAARRFVDWALSRSGSLIAPGGAVLKSGEDLPVGTMLHIVSFAEDPAKIRPLNDSDLNAFRDFPGVENSLGFRFADLTTAGMIKLGSLIQGKPIQSLGLVDMPIGLAWTRQPGGLAEITIATFQNINATDGEMYHIRILKYLRQLNLRFNKELTDACVESLMELKQLKSLHLDGTAITQTGLSRLRAAYPP